MPIPTAASAAAAEGQPLEGRRINDRSGFMLHPELPSRVKDEKGFTLIELLVVILIIGILAAIAIPAFLSQRGKAFDAAAKSNIGTALTAEEVYSTDNNGTYATDTLSSSDTGPLATIEWTSLKNAPYVKATANASIGFTLVDTAQETGDVYTLIDSAGVVTKTCSAGTGSGSPGGCAAGTW
jgi:type IV pilus assembly protein PilA